MTVLGSVEGRCRVEVRDDGTTWVIGLDEHMAGIRLRMPTEPVKIARIVGTSLGCQVTGAALCTLAYTEDGQLVHLPGSIETVVPDPEDGDSHCTGVSARWCPTHGRCSCVDPENLNDAGCPLHDPASPHGEGPPSEPRH